MNHEPESIDEHQPAFVDDVLRDPQRFQVVVSPASYWVSVVLSVCVAAAWHAAFVLILVGAYNFFEAFLTGSLLTNSLLYVVQIVVFGFISMILLPTFALIIAACIGGIVCPIFQAMLWSLGIDPRQLYLGGFVGGVIAYACSYTFYGSMITPLGSVSDGSPIILTVAIVLTLIATIMGQRAGILGARRILVESNFLVSYEVQRPRFQIKHLLWITFWVAAFLTVLKAISLFSPFFWAITGAWVVGQCFSLVAVLKYLGHREKKRELELERST